MVDRTQLTTAKSVQQRTGKTFHLATRVLPRRVRHPTYVLYAFFRLADEVVDGTEYDEPARQRAAFERLRAQAVGERPTDDPVVAAFAELVETHDVDPGEVESFVDAMAADIHRSRYDTYEALEGYMRGSAAAVGAMMMDVMDVADPETAWPHARALGEAFQLTNFLRDVREDVRDHGRVYLPAETLEAFGASVDDVLALEASQHVERAIQAELHRTEALYREGVAGIKYLPEDCQFAVLVSAVLYAEYHRAIRQRGYDVLTAAPEISRVRQLWLVARTAFEWQLSKDPETVFERVGAIPAGERFPSPVGPADPTTS